MNWNSWSDFIAMGGYGLYVWGSFLVTAGIFVAEIVQLRASAHASLSAPDLQQHEESV